MNDLFAVAEARDPGGFGGAKPSFIERQLPVSKLSKETYKERKANAGQTLTALGSYWKGRKPLILVRAVILGLLLPSTDDPAKDREIFLTLMLMDVAGLRKRKAKSIPVSRARQLLPASLHAQAFDGERWSKKLTRLRRAELELEAFDAMGLNEKLAYCVRPEELPESALDGIWPAVNAHLGTHAESLPDLVRELGVRRFGHVPRVGDPFCGGGSIPFEAAARLRRLRLRPQPYRLPADLGGRSTSSAAARRRAGGSPRHRRGSSPRWTGRSSSSASSTTP